MRSRGIVGLAALSAALVTGGWLVGRGLQGQGAGATNGARLFDQVVEHVSHYYVDSIGGDSLYEKALDGMVSELGDPHSVVLTPERLKRLAESTSGTYAGVIRRIGITWASTVGPTIRRFRGTGSTYRGVRLAELIA